MNTNTINNLFPDETKTMEKYNPAFEMDVNGSLEILNKLSNNDLMCRVHACEVAEYGEIKVSYYTDDKYKFLSDLPENHNLYMPMSVLNNSIIKSMTEANSGLTEDVANIFSGNIPQKHRVHGFDGFKFDGDKVIWAEQKPNKYSGKKVPTLSSSINDYTPKRFVKDRYLCNKGEYHFYFSYHDDKGKLLYVLGINAKYLLPLMEKTIIEDFNSSTVNRVSVPIAWTDLENYENESYLAWIDPNIDTYKDIIPGGNLYGKINKNGSRNKMGEKSLFAFLKRLEDRYNGNKQDISGELFRSLKKV